MKKEEKYYLEDLIVNKVVLPLKLEIKNIENKLLVLEKIIHSLKCEDNNNVD
jgi:RNAse (barnase) inhibitor barstar